MKVKLPPDILDEVAARSAVRRAPLGPRRANGIAHRARPPLVVGDGNAGVRCGDPMGMGVQ